MAAFVRNLWYAAGWATDIASDLIGIRILDEPVLLYRIPSGEAVAIGGTCPHRFAPLHLGRMCEDGSVECPYHGLRFDRTGACVLNPHENGRIPGAARVASYMRLLRPCVDGHLAGLPAALERVKAGGAAPAAAKAKSSGWFA